MKYPKTLSFLSGNRNFAELVNRLYAPYPERWNTEPINVDWIDDEWSAMMTERFEKVYDWNPRFLNVIKAERNPEIDPLACIAEDPWKRPRYILMTVIPDVPPSYEMNLPILEWLSVGILQASEVERAAVNACEHALDIQMSDKPNLPYLNRARVEWLSVYVGRKEFGGLTEIGQKFNPGEEPDYPFRCRLLRARERMDEPLVSRLIRAYEEDLEEGEKMLDGKKLE